MQRNGPEARASREICISGRSDRLSLRRSADVRLKHDARLVYAEEIILYAGFDQGKNDINELLQINVKRSAPAQTCGIYCAQVRRQSAATRWSKAAATSVKRSP